MWEPVATSIPVFCIFKLLLKTLHPPRSSPGVFGMTDADPGVLGLCYGCERRLRLCMPLTAGASRLRLCTPLAGREDAAPTPTHALALPPAAVHTSDRT